MLQASTQSGHSRFRMSEQRIGLLGGSFDPIHVAHLILASEALRQLDLHKVLFLPASRPPHKHDRDLTADEHRCAMIELAIAERSAFELSTADLIPGGPSYSADLVERIGDASPQAELFFIIGGDSLRDFHSWHEPHRITARATIVVAGRPGADYDLVTVLQQTPSLRGRLVELQSPLVEVSSTAIRQRIREHEIYWYQVPLAVERYISEHALYASAV